MATKISPNVDGTFEFNVHISKPAVYYILIGGGKSIKMYLVPGKVDSLTVKNEGYVFGGSNKACNAILAELEKSDEYCQSYRRVGLHELDKITSLEDFKKTIETRKTKDLDLLLTDGLPDDFVKQQKKDIDIRYRLLLARKICFRSDLTDDWLGELKKEINAISEGKNATMSYDYSALLKVVVSCRAIVLERKDPRLIRDSLHSFLFNNYCAILKGEQLEYALVFLIYGDFFQKDYSKDIPVLFSRFKKLFPGSRFIPILDAGVAETVGFHNVTLNNPDILFVEDSVVNNFDDLTRLFAGKVVYINLWTTWTSCIDMFSHLEVFKQTVKPMDITIYMAEDESDEKWKKMVHYHKLNGYNLWANSQLSDSIHRQFGNKNGNLSFPHYIIIDRDGKVAVNGAVSPGNPKEVIEQLKTVETLTVYIRRLFLFVFLYLVFSLIVSFAGKRLVANKFVAYNVLLVITAFVLIIIFGNTDNVILVLYLSLFAALNIYLFISGGLYRLHRIPLKIFLEFIIVFGLLSGVLVAIAYAGDFRIRDVFSGYFPDGSRTLVPGCWLEILQSALALALIIVGLKNTYNFYLASRINKVQYRQLRQSQLQKDLVQAKLDALQAKINPHFLYNSLNSIAGLALVDGEKTRQMALALSKFFRYGMNREQSNLTSLADELDIIRTYLDIEKIRFGERIDFSIMADKPSLEVLVPRMLLQPLVENSVKHGLKDGISKISIWVEAKICNGTLIVSVSDNGAPFVSDFVPGYGLKSVYDKLDLLFPGDYQVEILVNEKKQVRIEIPVSAVN